MSSRRLSPATSSNSRSRRRRAAPATAAVAAAAAAAPHVLVTWPRLAVSAGLSLLHLDVQVRSVGHHRFNSKMSSTVVAVVTVHGVVATRTGGGTPTDVDRVPTRVRVGAKCL